MNQTFTVAARLISQIVKDRRTLALMLVAPLFVLFVMYSIFNSASDEVTIGTVDVPDELVDILKEEADVELYVTTAKATAAMKDRDIQAFLDWQDGNPVILVEGGDVSKNRRSLQVVQGALAEYGQGKQLEAVEQLRSQVEELTGRTLPKPDTLSSPEIDFLYGDPEGDLFDQLAPALMGFFVFFFVFMVSGISFLKERTSGTLERTLVTPLKRANLVFGYFCGFFTFVVLQTVLIQLFIVNVLNVPQQGNYFALLAVNLLIASVALSLGLFLSSFARSEFQLFQFIPIVIVPQIFFSGIFDLSAAPTWVEVLNRIMPLTYAAHALQNMMIRGYGLSDVWVDLVVLFGFVCVFVSLNMRMLRKQRPV